MDSQGLQGAEGAGGPERVEGAALKEPPRFSEGAMESFRTIRERFPHPCMRILPTLKLAQREFGYLSDPVIRMVSELLEVPPAHLRSVASFYTMLHNEPVGRYVVQVCRTLPCALRGADDVADHLEERLGIRPGETTPDGRFTLMKVECLGACGTAPVVQINDDYHENLTLERLDEILDGLP